MAESTIKTEWQGPVLRITLNRPEVRNALDERLIADLRGTFKGLEHFARVVVLTGEGSAFCAGGDLEYMRRAAGHTQRENYDDALKIAGLLSEIASCHAVTVALVNGHAYGGGAGLTAACDIAIASSSAQFAFSEARLGLVPATISPYVLDKIGRSHLRALFSTGEAFGAEKALSIGLVHEIASPEGLEEALAKKLGSVLGCGPEAVAVSKRLGLQDRLSLEESARLLSDVRAGAEAREGVAAFLEKRKPSYAAEIS